MPTSTRRWPACEGWTLPQHRSRRWQREGILEPGQGGGWAWTDADTGKQTASIGYSTEPGAVVLNYTMNDKPMRRRLPILTTPCHFGGERQWFACPHCARRGRPAAR